MGLSTMKKDVHDRLWNAQQRWFAMREEGHTTHELKMRGLREAGDPKRFTRNVIFVGTTRVSYERTLKSFVEFAHREFGVQKVDEIGKKEFRAYMDQAIQAEASAKTLNHYRNAIAKLGALMGRTESFAALSKQYGKKIRELARGGVLKGPSRKTLGRETLERPIEILRVGGTPRDGEGGA